MATTTPEITLYSAKICPWAQRATLAVEETGAKVKHVEIDLKNKPSWYASTVNPASKVSVLQVGEAKIPESHVILELISDLFPGKIAPSDPVLKAEARYFIERFNQIVSTPFFANLLHGKEDSVACILAGITEIQTLLEKHNGPFALGQDYSIADIGVTPFIGRFFSAGKAGLLTGTVYETVSTDPKYALFVTYANTLFARPSFAATFDEAYIVEGTKARVAAIRAAA